MLHNMAAMPGVQCSRLQLCNDLLPRRDAAERICGGPVGMPTKGWAGLRRGRAGPL